MRDWIQEVRARRTGNHANPTHTRLLSADPLAVGLEQRFFGGRLGVCIHVYGEREGLAHELLRIDCFSWDPHYHRGWSLEDEVIHVAPMEDPWAWGLARLREHLPALAAPDTVDVADLLARLSALRATF